MPTAAAILSKIVVTPTTVSVYWTCDSAAVALAEAYVSATIFGLSDPNLRFRGCAGTPAYPQLPGTSFFTAPFPVAQPFLAPETLYYVRANCDGILSDVRGFVTPPRKLPPSPILIRMGAKPKRVFRPGWGTYDSTGKFVEIQGTEFQALSSIQPDESLREVLKLPEGQRDRQLVRVYSDVRLLQASQQAGQKGDRFEYNGRLYEVYRSGSWSVENKVRIGFWKSYAWTVEQDNVV